MEDLISFQQEEQYYFMNNLEKFIDDGLYDRSCNTTLSATELNSNNFEILNEEFFYDCPEEPEMIDVNDLDKYINIKKSTSDIQTDKKQHIIKTKIEPLKEEETLELLDVFELSCKLCQLDFSSTSNYNEHVNSQNHRRLEAALYGESRKSKRKLSEHRIQDFNKIRDKIIQDGPLSFHIDGLNFFGNKPIFDKQPVVENTNQFPFYDNRPFMDPRINVMEQPMIDNLYQAPFYSNQFFMDPRINNVQQPPSINQIQQSQYSYQTHEQQYNYQMYNQPNSDYQMYTQPQSNYKMQQSNSTIHPQSFRQKRQSQSIDQANKALSVDQMPKRKKSRRSTADTSHKYECEYCKKTFSNCSNLRRHENLHKSEFHQCHKCMRIFQQKEYLKKHMTTHKKAIYQYHVPNMQNNF